MKPPVLNIQATSTMTGIDIPMEIDQSGLAHIIGLVTNLYSDVELAIIREYSTNAMDAHRDAGTTRPIEITTPSTLNPYFTIKDYGVGLSVEEITNIYSKYGASTKRGDNTTVGMLGVGGKSALAYADQFTVVAIKNGVKASVVVSKQENGVGLMKIVDTCSTTEPNGVQISVPVKSYNEFAEKTANFFRFWADGQVLVNGKEPEKIEMTPVSDRTFVANSLNTDYVVMGGVAYPLDHSHSIVSEWSKSFGVVAFVDIGDINFVPSREALNYDVTKTIQTLADLRVEFEAGIEKAISTDIDLAPNHLEAIKRAEKWGTMYRSRASQMTYKGDKIVTYAQGTFKRYAPHQGRYAVQSQGSFDIMNLVNSTGMKVVTGFSRASLTAAHREKARYWAEQNNFHGNFVFVDEMSPAPWVSDIPSIDFDTEIASIKIPRAKRASEKKPKYNVMNDNGTIVEAEEIDDSKPIYYYSPSDLTKIQETSRFRRVYKNCTIVELGMNRWDKFKREFPEAIHLRSDLGEKCANFFAEELTEEEQRIIMLDSYSVSKVKSLDPDSIDDPEVSEFIRALGGQHSQNVVYFEALNMLCYHMLNRPATRGKTEYDPLVNYPLANVQHKDHTYIYMNAVYAAAQAKENDNAV